MTTFSTVPPTPPPAERTSPGSDAEYSIPSRRRVAIDRIAGRTIPDPPPPLPAPTPARGPVRPKPAYRRGRHRTPLDLAAVLHGESRLGRIAILLALVWIALVAFFISPLLLIAYVLHVRRETRRRIEHEDALERRVADWRRRVRSRNRARRRFGDYRCRA